MKLPFLRFEFFLSRAAPHQGGVWVDHDESRWMTVGLGRHMLTMARLFNPKH